ncbi:hypothetical protein OIU78_006915 [Salix suchowensis]|nr:hypothetical protein OIU78_006915 [Salix suchowensis]
MGLVWILFIIFLSSLWLWNPSGLVGARWHCLVVLATLHALSCLIVGSLLDQYEPGPRPPYYINNLPFVHFHFKPIHTNL